MSSSKFGYQFPSLKGIQAGREYFISQCPIRLLPRIFAFDDSDLPVEARAQRTLNKDRVPEITRYILQNRNEYVFSAITASIDADVTFTPLDSENPEIGVLSVPLSARFIVNDGQHRRAALSAALETNPELGDETIAVVFFIPDFLTTAERQTYYKLWPLHHWQVRHQGRKRHGAILHRSSKRQAG
jgi:DNA sulfur modification protein DndB